jgi:hypothetical protein
VNKFVPRVSHELLTAADFLRPCRGMTTKTRNWLLAIVILAFPFVLFLGCLIFMDEPLPPLAPLPNPNGYEDLVKAAKMIKGETWAIYDTASMEKLRGIVFTNAAALALARIALTNPCGVPPQFTKASQTNRAEDVMAFKGLSQAIACVGKLAEKENRFGDAAKSYLDAVRLGSQITHGGIVLDELAGISAAWYGETQLQGIVTNLDASSCRRAAATLETLAGDRQNFSAALQQEEAWYRRALGWRSEWFKLIYFSERQHRFKNAKEKLDQFQQEENRLLVDLAARAYELDKGHPPASAADLVPDYLKAIPQDPVTGTNIVWRVVSP